MIPPLAASLVATAGVYAFVALHFGGLWWMRRSAAEHGAFALHALCLAAFALATASTVVAHDVAEAAGAQRAMYVVAMFAGSSYVTFCSRASGRPALALERVAWTCAVVLAALGAAGLFVDPALPPAGSTLGGTAAAQLLPVALAAFGITLGLAAAGAIHLARAARKVPSLRPTAVAVCIPFAAGAWDVGVRVTAAPLPTVSAIASVAAIAAISWALLGRLARIDAELAQRTEELAASYDRLRHAQEELVRKEQLAAIGELSAVIAHEVRNPLAIIRNSVSSLRKAQLRAEDADALLSILDEEADRLNRLVQDLLAYARPADPEHETIDLPDLLERAVELAREGQAQRRNVSFDVRVEPGVGAIECDPALLRHALINIADNAIEAMPEGGTVTVRCRAAEIEGAPAIAIVFHDEGEGMDTLVRSRARDPFFTTRSSGTGLGLAIVDRVARVHGGRVEIESRHGQGTTVTLLLPRLRSSLPTPGVLR